MFRCGKRSIVYTHFPPSSEITSILNLVLNISIHTDIFVFFITHVYVAIKIYSIVSHIFKLHQNSNILHISSCSFLCSPTLLVKWSPCRHGYFQCHIKFNSINMPHFIYSLVDWHSTCFQFSTFPNKALVDFLVQVILCSLGNFSRVVFRSGIPESRGVCVFY